MPTDETTLEALERLAERYERQAAHHARDAHDFAESPVPVLRLTAPELAKQAAENALIADALRFRLAALSATVSEDTARLDELERVANAAGGIHLHNGSHTGCNGLGLAGTGRTLRQAVDDMRAARASVRRFAEVTASLPRGGADV